MGKIDPTKREAFWLFQHHCHRVHREFLKLSGAIADLAGSIECQHILTQ
jgi:hypothetical protein